MDRSVSACACALGLLLTSGCHGSASFTVPDGYPAPGGTVVAPEPVPEPGEPAAHLVIRRVSVYQGVERPLWSEGAPGISALPVIAERAGLLRVFVDPLPGFVPRSLRAVLTVEVPGAAPLVLEDLRSIRGPSLDGELASTFVFDLEAADLPVGAELRVELRELPGVPGAIDGSAVTFDSGVDLPGGLPLVPGRDLEVVVLPFRYDADGSGRLPDTSPAALEAIREELEAVYPVRSVAVRVAPAVPWSLPILRDGTGFDLALEHVIGERGAAAEGRNVYYYGLFDPAPSLAAWCPQACVTGLSLLVSTVAYPALQASVGVGYREGNVAVETLAHELAHAHGRAHAPCGGPLGVDPDFPHDGGTTGAWGYDARTDRLLDPAQTFDMMGYCSPSWVSDYTFAALQDRIEFLESPLLARGERTVTQVRMAPDGSFSAPREVRVAVGALPGEPVRVAVVDAQGAPAGGQDGWQVPYDHLPGGLILLEEGLPEGGRVVGVHAADEDDPGAR